MHDVIVPTPCLTVVMPCYNERPTIEMAVDRVLASPWTAELLVVDDGSTDGSRDVLATLVDPRLRVLTQTRNQGKGAALRRGFAEARQPYVVVQDADYEYNPADFDELLGPLIDGRADVVFGSRFHSSRPHRVLYYWHSVGNRMLTVLSNMFTNLNLTDMETCYKAFRREVLDSFVIEEDRFGVEPEITAKVARGGWRVFEVGIAYDGRTYAEGKKIGWRDGIRAAICIVRYSAVGAWFRRRGPELPAPVPASFEDADDELCDTLDNLDDAHNYAAWIYALLEPHLGAKVLEVGAGHGTLTTLLMGGRMITATDLSTRCVTLLEDRFGSLPEFHAVQAGIDDLKSLDGPYDSAVLVNVLEHIADDAGAVSQLRDVLVPGGTLCLYVPAFPALYSDFDRRIGHYRRYRSHDLATLMDEAGLEMVQLHYVNAVGAALWWLFACKLGGTPTSRWPALAFDRLAVPVVRRAEQAWTPPFGQSVLCVARRPA